jgi:heat shock protein HslJ
MTVGAGLVALSLSGSASAQSPSAVASGIAGTSWELSALGGIPVVSGTPVTLLFAADRAGGYSGCNQYVAAYATDGVSSLTFGPVAATRRSCGEEADAFETSYLTALGTVTGFRSEEGRLLLLDDAGTSALTFGGAPPATVEGPWAVTMVNNGKGAVTSVPADVSASVAFGPDGLLEGFGGCNSFSGGYSVDEDTIAIGPLMSTMMACGDPQDTLESQLLTALQASTTWSVSGGVLDLRDDGGAQQVEATRAIGQ